MTIKRTQFIDYGIMGSTYGFRCYDDQEQSYSNSMTESELKQDDNQFLHNVINNYADDTFTRLFDWALHHTHFIVIDDVEYVIETNMDDSWKLIEKI